MCKPEEIRERFNQARLHPIEPIIVDDGPVYEEVHIGDSLLEHGGLDEFPIPISTPGFDVAPFITAPFWVTKDPETGARNVGAYRSQLKAPLRTGVSFMTPTQGGAIHWRKCRERGTPLEAAIVVGGPPSIGYVSTAPLDIDEDELKVAGGIAGEPLELVRCKTVNLEVPAHAEIVIEGEITTSETEPESPFGEITGFIGLSTDIYPYFTVKCIAHRKKPTWLYFISQFPPNEGTKIRQTSVVLVGDRKITLGDGTTHEYEDKLFMDTPWMVIGSSGTSGLFEKFREMLTAYISSPEYDGNVITLTTRIENITRELNENYREVLGGQVFDVLIGIKTTINTILRYIFPLGFAEGVRRYKVIGHGEPYGSFFMKRWWRGNMRMLEVAELGLFIISYIQEFELDNSVGIGDGHPQVWLIPNIPILPTATPEQRMLASPQLISSKDMNIISDRVSKRLDTFKKTSWEGLSAQQG